MQKLTTETQTNLNELIDDLMFYKSFAKEHLEKENTDRYHFWMRQFYAALLKIHADYGLLPWDDSIEEAQAAYKLHDRVWRDDRAA